MSNQPQQIGDYVVGKRLGAGSIGTVYAGAHLQHPEQRVALKVLNEKLGEEGTAAARFRREEAAIRAISHPNVVKVLDYLQLPDSHACIVMEYIEGEMLLQFTKHQPEGRLPPLLACQIFTQLADGLACAHRQNIIHRDLKPANVMITAAEEQPGGCLVRILDFGIAKAGSTEFTQINTEDGAAIIGTPAYMAPEQFVRPSQVDGRADVYSLGVMLYRCLSSKLPFDVQGKMEPLAECVQYYELHNSVQPPELPADLPESLRRLTMRMLSKQPVERPWMNELVTLFGSIAEQLGQPAETVRHATLSRTEFTNLFSNEGKRIPKVVSEHSSAPLAESGAAALKEEGPTHLLSGAHGLPFAVLSSKQGSTVVLPRVLLAVVALLAVWAIVVTVMLVLR